MDIKKKILPFVMIKDLEGIMLTEIKFDRKKQILCDLTYTWNLKQKQNQKNLMLEKDWRFQSVATGGKRAGGGRRREIGGKEESGRKVQTSS